MKEQLKKLLLISNRNLDYKLATIIHYIIDNYSDITVFNISREQYDKDFVLSMIEYDSFTNLVKKNRLNEIYDLSVKEAKNLVKNNQEKYLNTPIYVIYTDIEILNIECGHNEFLYRFGKYKKG